MCWPVDPATATLSPAMTRRVKALSSCLGVRLLGCTERELTDLVGLVEGGVRGHAEDPRRLLAPAAELAPELATPMQSRSATATAPWSDASPAKRARTTSGG